MKVFNGFIIAFSMYSKIPMPKADWNEENMKYSLCFFPLIGLLIGFLIVYLKYLCDILDFNHIVFAGLGVWIPILITGGIHMDGFCDTCDALASHQPKKKKLEIMKDSNSGAFAIIKSVMYFLLYFALLTEISFDGVIILGFGHVISRCFAGISVLRFKNAKACGLVQTFNSMSSKKISCFVLVFILVLSISGMIITNWIMGMFSAIITFFIFGYYKCMIYKEIGGITGDTTGYLVQICEIGICFSIIIAEGVLRLWN